MVSSFEQTGAQLADVAQQQTDLQRAVAAGELWMEAGVAERAAARCDQAVEDIDDWLARADVLTKRREFGTNEDGEAAAARFAQAGQEFHRHDEERSTGVREHGSDLPGGRAHNR